MKTMTTLAAIVLSATTAYAETLAERVERYNREDQRAVSGTLNAQTGMMTIVTQDMAEGYPGKGLSPRSFDVDLSALKGVDGQDGADGVDGIDGRNGQDYDPHALAAVTAMGSLQMSDPLKGVTTWSLGFGGQGGETGVAAGIRYGFTDDLSGYATLGTSLDGKGTSWGVGVSGRF